MSRRDKWAIAGIWVVVFIGAMVFAAFIADDDPNTSEGAGAGALAFVVGGGITGIYMAIRHRHAVIAELKKEAANATSRKRRAKTDAVTGSGSYTERNVVPESPRRPRPRQWWVDVIGAGVLWIIGAVIVEVVLGLDVSYDAWIGGLLPLAFLVVRHLHRSAFP